MGDGNFGGLRRIAVPGASSRMAVRSCLRRACDWSGRKADAWSPSEGRVSAAKSIVKAR